jgi:hypothetical protein
MLKRVNRTSAAVKERLPGLSNSQAAMTVTHLDVNTTGAWQTVTSDEDLLLDEGCLNEEPCSAPGSATAWNADDEDPPPVPEFTKSKRTRIAVNPTRAAE